MASFFKNYLFSLKKLAEKKVPRACPRVVRVRESDESVLEEGAGRFRVVIRPSEDAGRAVSRSAWFELGRFEECSRSWRKPPILVRCAPR